MSVLSRDVGLFLFRLANNTLEILDIHRANLQHITPSHINSLIYLRFLKLIPFLVAANNSDHRRPKLSQRKFRGVTKLLSHHFQFNWCLCALLKKLTNFTLSKVI